jgi:DNA-binding response OmpR family regulator
MPARVLIVEDEIFVATEIEYLIEDMGHVPVAIAGDQRTALRHAQDADVALVDLNLRDGPTGAQIGQILAQTHGVTVLFMTANPAQLGDGVEGTVGVLAKPASESEIKQALSFVIAKHNEETATPPQRLKLFGWGDQLATGA